MTTSRFSSTLFEIAYRTGGTLNCRWVRVLDRFTAEQAAAKAAEIERMGYRTVTHRAGVFDALGLPEGWAAA